MTVRELLFELAAMPKDAIVVYVCERGLQEDVKQVTSEDDGQIVVLL